MTNTTLDRYVQAVNDGYGYPSSPQVEVQQPKRGLFSGLTDFAGGLVKGIARFPATMANSVVNVVGDLPYNVENWIYQGDKGIHAAGNYLGSKIDPGGGDYATRMMNDATVQRDNALINQKDGSLISTDPNKRLFSKYGTAVTNNAYDLAHDQANQDAINQGGFVMRDIVNPALKYLSPDKRRDQNTGYTSDLINLALYEGPSVIKSVGGPSVSSALGKAGLDAAEENASQSFVKGLFNEGVNSRTAKNVIANVGGSFVQNAGFGAAQSIANNVDEGKPVNWKDVGQNALYSGAGGAVMSVGQNALPRKNVMSTGKSDLYAGESAKGFPEAQGKFSNITDQKPRFEIDDSKAKVLDLGSNEGIQKVIDARKQNRTLSLGSILDHEELYKQYPELRNIPVDIVSMEGKQKGSFSKDNGGVITVDEVTAIDPEKLKSTLLHETQHYIQNKEGFAHGGSARNITDQQEFIDFYNKKYEDYSKLLDTPNKTKEQISLQSKLKEDLDALDSSPYEAYKRLAGEVESRDVQARMNLTAEERAKLSPLASQKIAAKDQIITKDSGVAQSVESVRKAYDKTDPNNESFREMNINNIRAAGKGDLINNDGYLELYHGTSDKNAKSIKDSGELRGNTYFATDETTAAKYARQVGSKKTEVIKTTVDPSDVLFDGNYFTSRKPKLILDDDGVYRGEKVYKKSVDDKMMSYSSDDFELDTSSLNKQKENYKPEIKDIDKKSNDYLKKNSEIQTKVEDINKKLSEYTAGKSKDLGGRTSAWFEKNGSKYYSGEIYQNIKKLFEERDTLQGQSRSYDVHLKRNIISNTPELKQIRDELTLLKDPEYVKTVKENGIDPEAYRRDLIQELNDKVSAHSDAYKNKYADESITKKQTKVKDIPKSTPHEESTTLPERKFATTLKESDNTAPEVKQKLNELDTTYFPTSNKKDLETAHTRISENAAKAESEIRSTTNPDAVDNLTAQLLIQKKQLEGDFEGAADLALHLAKQGTTRGQFIQAFSVWDKLSPEGILTYTQKQIERNKVKEPLTPEAAKALVEKAKEADQLPVGSIERQRAKIDLLKEVNDVSQTRMQKFSSFLTDFRYANMLSSPNTHINNAFGNSIQTFVTAPATKFATGVIDSVSSKFTGKEREVFATEGFKNFAGSFGHIPEAIKNFTDVMKGVKLSDNTELGKAPVGGKAYQMTFGQISKLLQASDQFFKTVIAGGEQEALAYRYKKLGKEVHLEDIKAEAQKKADYFTFNSELDPSNKSGQGKVLSWFDKGTQWINNGKNTVPGISWFLPFVKVPMNILKQGVEYSPMGLTTLVGASNKKEQLAKVAVGSAVMMGAAYLAHMGDATWSAPTSEKEKSAFYESGKQAYSIKIGNKWISFSKLGPLAYPIAIAAATKHFTEVDPKGVSDDWLNRVGDIAMGTLKFFSDQSYMKSLGDLVKAVSGDTTAAKNFASNFPSQLIPFSGFQGWLTRLIDPVQRSPQNVLEAIEDGIPGLSYKVNSRKNADGTDQKRDNNTINAFLPLKVTNDNPEADKKYDILQYQNIQDRINKIKNATNTGEIKEQDARDQIQRLEQRQQQMGQNIQTSYGITVSPSTINNTVKQIAPTAKKENLHIFTTGRKGRSGGGSSRPRGVSVRRPKLGRYSGIKVRKTKALKTPKISKRRNVMAGVGRRKRYV